MGASNDAILCAVYFFKNAEIFIHDHLKGYKVYLKICESFFIRPNVTEILCLPTNVWHLRGSSTI